MTDLTLDTRVVRNPDLIAVPMDGDLVMMSVEHGQYFGMSGVATRYWDLFEKPATLREAAQAVCTEFDVDEDTCGRDLLTFTQELLSRGLVIVA